MLCDKIYTQISALKVIQLTEEHMKDFQKSTDNRINHVFPLGGIGTGSIGFAYSGRLCGFEICNKPGVFRENAMCLFAIKASKADGSLCDARLLQSEDSADGGFLGFDESCLEVRFPFASKKYECGGFPGKITQTVFNPFIPHNETDSGIPCAFFEFEIENTSDEAVKYSVAGVLNNFLPKPVNTVGCTESGALYISMTGNGNISDCTDGNLCFATDAKSFSYLENVSYDGTEAFLRDFLSNENLENSSEKVGTAGAICAHLKLEPAEKKTVRFAFSWYFPIYYNYIEPCERVSIETDEEYALRNSWRNYYAQYFESSTECAGYCFAHWERLKSDTLRFTDSLYNSTLGTSYTAAVSKSLSTLKSTRFIRLDNGALFALDLNSKNGSDVMGALSFSLVNELSLEFLYPSLARVSLTNSFRYDMTTSGKVSNRLCLPTGKKTDFKIDTNENEACNQAQAGLVIRACRAFLMNGDFEQLVEEWMYITRCLDYYVSEERTNRVEALCDENLREYVLLLVSLKAGAYLAGIVSDKKRELEYAQHFAEGAKAMSVLSKTCDNVRVLEGQLHADLMGFGDIFDSDYLMSSLRAIYKNHMSGQRLSASDAYIVSSLMLRRSLSKEAEDVLSSISHESENSPLGYDLLCSVTGFSFDMSEKKVRVLPDMRYIDKTGTFKCFFALGGCFGYVEEGVDYVEFNLASGKLPIRSIATPARPLMVLYGGRKWKFEDTGCCAKLDCDLTLTPDKKLTVIIDVKKSN